MYLAEYLVRLRNRSLTGTSSTIETQTAEDLNDYCARQHVRIELLSLAEQEACEWCALREKVMNRMTGIE